MRLGTKIESRGVRSGHGTCDHIASECDRPECMLEGFDSSPKVDRHVDPPGMRLLFDASPGVLGVWINHCRCSEADCDVASRWQGINPDDRGSAGKHCKPQRQKSNGPETEHRDCVADPDVSIPDSSERKIGWIKANGRLPGE